MEETVYNYLLDKDVYTYGINITGGMGISVKKKIILTILAAVALANEIYGFVNTGKIESYVLLFAIFALIFTTWIGPIIDKHSRFKNFEEREVTIKVSEKQITKTDKEQTIITAANYRGFDDKEKYFVVYYNKGYFLLPKNATDGFGVERTREILGNFHATAVEPNIAEKEEN